MRYAFIGQERPNYPVRPLCRAMRVSVAGFYHWRKREPSQRALEQLKVVTAIRVAHAKGRGFYGPEKLHDELKDDGHIEVSYNRIRRHSTIGNVAPVEFARRYYAAQLAA